MRIVTGIAGGILFPYMKRMSLWGCWWIEPAGLSRKGRSHRIGISVEIVAQKTKLVPGNKPRSTVRLVWTAQNVSVLGTVRTTQLRILRAMAITAINGAESTHAVDKGVGINIQITPLLFHRMIRGIIGIKQPGHIWLARGLPGPG